MSKVNFVTPEGRIVSGSLSRPNTTDINGRPLVWNSGSEQGQPRQEYYVGLAVPKNHPGLQAFFEQLGQAAAPAAQGGQLPGNFSWKMVDGDGNDRNGKPYAEREGHAGCFIFKFSSSYAPRCFSSGGGSEITKEEIKTGDYVRIAGTAEFNKNAQMPGIYLNLNMVELVGYGTEIVSGPSGQEVFGGTPAQMPAGASAQPIAAPNSQFGQQPAPNAGMPQGQPMQPQGQPMQPQSQPAPGPAGMPPQGQPMQQPPQGQPGPGPAGMPPQGQPMQPQGQPAPGPAGMPPQGQPAPGNAGGPPQGQPMQPQGQPGPGGHQGFMYPQN